MYIFKTTKHIKVLGFALNFVDMTAKINPIKVKLVLEKIENSLDYKKPITRQLVAIIGLCVSLFPVSSVFLVAKKSATAKQEPIISIVPKIPASSHTFIEEAIADGDLPEKVFNIICL